MLEPFLHRGRLSVVMDAGVLGKRGVSLLECVNTFVIAKTTWVQRGLLAKKN